VLIRKSITDADQTMGTVVIYVVLDLDIYLVFPLVVRKESYRQLVLRMNVNEYFMF
jgi:hypothetical protein